MLFSLAEIRSYELTASSEGEVMTAYDMISFSNVDIITPSQKLLARQLTCRVVQGESMLVTGERKN